MGGRVDLSRTRAVTSRRSGTDEAGRRQYIYHPTWVEQRSAEKYDRVLRFGRRLPRVRERVLADLGERGGVRGGRVRGRRTTAGPGLLPDRQRRLHRGERFLRAHDAGTPARRARNAGSSCSSSSASPASSTGSRSTTCSWRIRWTGCDAGVRRPTPACWPTARSVAGGR